ncbi:PepSY domain-containing protein [Robiginitomaculum antarcticum]|uniref:PepSY domain-containing protein n=1 Tax=Robiginitomaculum antarcticum TaxID=437507 RepID=UPI000375DCE9|nr:PepSY domain-containing protein [Robiginitomaculum antarcticum]
MTITRLHKLTFGAACAAMLAFGVPSVASAQTRTNGPDYTARQSYEAVPMARRRAAPPGQYQVAQNQISPSQAKAIAMRAVPRSKYLDLRMDGSGYRVRLINKDGERVEVFVDARSGAYRIVRA